MALSPLEAAVVDGATALHESPFGMQLRAFRSERQSAGFRSELAMFETGGGNAPIIRTLSILAAIGAGTTPVAAPRVEDEDYLQWIRAAKDALNRVGTRLWDSMMPGPRQLVVDEDDLPQWATGYLAGGRYDTSTHGLASAGFSPEAIRTLGAISDRLSATDLYRAGKAAAAQILGDRALRDELIAVRGDFLASMSPARPETLGDARNRIRLLIDKAYRNSGETAQRVAAALRGVNHLINCIGWTLLCAAEAESGIPVVVDEVQPIRATHGSRSLVIRFSTVADIGWIAPPSPMRLNLGCPLDGIYLLQKSRLQMTYRTLHDIEAWSLRELELAP